MSWTAEKMEKALDVMESALRSGVARASGPVCAGCGALVGPGGGRERGRWDCGAEACIRTRSGRAEVLEVTGGVPVLRKIRTTFELRPGDRGRLTEGGEVVVVDRVAGGTAFVHEVYDPPREMKWGPWEELESAGRLLVLAMTEGTPDQAWAAACHARAQARLCRTAMITRGPDQPGISARTVLLPA
jgi:hypothetical protein